RPKLHEHLVTLQQSLRTLCNSDEKSRRKAEITNFMIGSQKVDIEISDQKTLNLFNKFYPALTQETGKQAFCALNQQQQPKSHDRF
uniref:Uncharacterized protein n=1 Tax=Romanomermis culicivorax TaxID=13658 RepID=A0A915LBK9_ROMCU